MKQRGLLKAFLAGAFFISTECTCGQAFDDPMSWWAHFVWACPNTQAGREYLKLPQHVGKHSLDGLDNGFMERIGQYLHLPWVQTAVLPDPRAQAPGPASPAITEWKVPAEGQALFSGTCFGDGACGRQGPVMHRRAGWAVGVAYLHYGRAGAFRIGPNAAGTLPGHLQSPEGAELYCLVFWLRHLDPCSRVRPRLYLDCQTVVDGWHKRWHTLAPWTPHRDLWEEVERLREDTMEGVDVIWIRSHGRAAADCHGPHAQLLVFGNAWADKRAKEAATWHPSEAQVQVSQARTHKLATQLCVAYAKMLEWATAVEERLPPISVLECLFKTPRPPALPAHTLALDQEGRERCVRCMLPACLIEGRPCRPHGTLGHDLYSLADGIFCNRCGVYSFSQLCHIGAVCRGKAVGRGTEWRLNRMRAGRHPTKAGHLGTAKRIDTSLGVFAVLLG